LRELVSNAWDANARLVRIQTNYPNFYQIVIQDNGDGFPKDEFIRLMGGNIGNSQKRPKQQKLINGRTTIGRLGIGMLGIAQICGSFKVTSMPKDGEPFTARIRLYDLLRERVDADDPDLVKTKSTPRKNGSSQDGDETYTEVDVGTYTFERFEPMDDETGTRILADDVHPTFSESFQESLKNEDFEEPPLNWRAALKVMAGVHSLQQLGDYWKLLWELAASCPVPYVSTDALPKGLATKEQERLKSYDFRVEVDGIELAKPVYLKGNPGGYTAVPITQQDRRVYARNLRFHGYLLVQEGRQIQPDELRGVMIRIKNVGIGYYDPSMLDYRFNQGPRSRWLTGEIFVDEGLEDALNIDRDSFNRFHPQFRVVQQYVHQLLEHEVFPAVYKNIDVRSHERAAERSAKRKTSLSDVIEQVTGRKVEMAEASTLREDAEPVPTITRKGKSLRIILPPVEAVPTKKAHQQMATAIMAIYEVASFERNLDTQRRLFSELMFQLFRNW
jgi:hypothetical protein